jgi:sulfite oxidase
MLPSSLYTATERADCINRRRFLHVSSIATLSAGAWAYLDTRGWGLETSDASSVVRGKDARLIVHSQRPVELETPIELLRQHDITPARLIFVRNNQALDKSLSTDPVNDPQWSVELDGLIEFPRSITVAELSEMDQVEQTLVLQCSGNGRAYFSESAAASGSQWLNGAMANVKFKGVPLKAVIERLKANVSSVAKYVTGEGKDSPIKADAADFEHSIPLDDALDRSLLALQLNGEPIPAVHGGPVRLVTPGYYGTMNVKWLSRLRFESQETANHHQVKRYRTPLTPIAPGAKFEYSLDNSEPNWEMRIKSVIFVPLDKQVVPAGKVKVEGVAWNDGAARIATVEVSSDSGATWKKTTLQAPDSPFAWHHWSTEIDLPRGKHQICCRAIDALGRTQPKDGSIHWNPAGYAWNGIQSVRVEAT